MDGDVAELSKLPLSPRVFAWLYLGWVLTAEVVTIFYSPEWGLWLHVALLAALLIHGTRGVSRPVSRAWLCIAFAPLIRVVSLATPLADFRLVYWYLLTGIPIFIAAFVLLRYFGLPGGRFALQMRWTPSQILVGFSGLALGYIEYLILSPSPLVPEPSLFAILESLLILVVFTGLVEEIVFRGLMQHAVSWILGKAGIFYVSLIFTFLHLGYRSIADLIFVMIVALYFGYFVHRTRSILGVTLAHGLTNVSLFLIFPFLLAGSVHSKEEVQKGLLSPPYPSPSVTPTPFQPQTPTPFQPYVPNASPSPTPTLSPEGESRQLKPPWIEAGGVYTAPGSSLRVSVGLRTLTTASMTTQQEIALVFGQGSRSAFSAFGLSSRLGGVFRTSSTKGRPQSFPQNHIFVPRVDQGGELWIVRQNF